MAPMIRPGDALADLDPATGRAAVIREAGCPRCTCAAAKGELCKTPTSRIYPERVRAFGAELSALAEEVGSDARVPHAGRGCTGCLSVRRHGSCVTIVLTRRQYIILHTETLAAMQSAENDDDAAVWGALHTGVSASRWRLPSALVGTATMYCRGIVETTEDDVVRRSYEALLRKLAAVGHSSPPAALISKKACVESENR